MWVLGIIQFHGHCFLPHICNSVLNFTDDTCMHLQNYSSKLCQYWCVQCTGCDQIIAWKIKFYCFLDHCNCEFVTTIVFCLIQVFTSIAPHIYSRVCRVSLYFIDPNYPGLIPEGLGSKDRKAEGRRIPDAFPIPGFPMCFCKPFTSTSKFVKFVSFLSLSWQLTPFVGR